jgi:hypothetical protein
MYRRSTELDVDSPTDDAIEDVAVAFDSVPFGTDCDGMSDSFDSKLSLAPGKLCDRNY